jgi:hypothetical protein
MLHRSKAIPRSNSPNVRMLWMMACNDRTVERSNGPQQYNVFIYHYQSVSENENIDGTNIYTNMYITPTPASNMDNEVSE